MDTEPINTSEDAEMAESEGEKVVTMMDVLQEQEDFEEDVNAVLGASDDKNCTYAKGYIKRQAIYACVTCCSDAKDDPTKRAGVCLACSLNCHENHDLIELYTKRNFKCDCGNPKFNSHPCQFTPDKTDLNEENNYNQNFSGVYCVCQRPYPDPDSTVDVEMIQCIICEDWLHASHLEATVPDSDQYSEMICKGCMENNDFLHDYSNLAVNIDVDVETNGIDNDNKICNGDIKLETFKDETINAEPANNTNHSEDSTDKTNGENTCDTQESPTEKKDDDKSEDTPMETDDLKEVDTNTNNLEVATEKDIKESSENLDENITPDVAKDGIVEETIKDICTISGNAGKEDNNQSESSVNQEEQNENEEPTTETKQTENAAEEKNSIEKSAEQLEEERLLADPDSDNKKTKFEANANNEIVENNAQTLADASKNTEETGTENNETLGINENEEAKVDNIDKQNESSNIIGSPTKIIRAETLTEEEVEVKDNLKENGTTETNEADTNNESHNGETEVQNNEKINEKRKLSTEESSDTEIKKVKLDEASKPCVRPKGVQKVYKGATFWPSTFRQKLCTCRECITMYTDLSVLYLIDPEDTVTAYENLGKHLTNGKPASQYEKGLQALSSLDRIQQINALTEYNKMRDKLLDFLKSFKDRREVVKEEDIKAFFAGMKPKREPDGVYFCR